MQNEKDAAISKYSQKMRQQEDSQWKDMATGAHLDKRGRSMRWTGSDTSNTLQPGFTRNLGLPDQDLSQGLLGSPLVGALRNTYQTMQDYDEHGGLASPTIPREYDVAEAGTNAWPVPSWWNRVPTWWDKAPQWWDAQAETWAAQGRIAGQPEAGMISAVN